MRLLALAATVAVGVPLVAPGADGKLAYRTYTEQGDRIPDFSNCGYGGGGVALPRLPVKATVAPVPGDGDDLARLQEAVDQVSRLPLDAGGFRGAVLLKRGEYRLSNSLQIGASGVVLRGEGAGKGGTVLVGTARKQHSLVTIKGASKWDEVAGGTVKVTDRYVPVGSRTVNVANGAKFAVGDTVLVVRHGNAAWIHEIGMDLIKPRPDDPQSTKQWKPFDLVSDRVVTRVEGNRLMLDAPVPCAIDERWGGGEVRKYDDRGRIERCGIENLSARCVFDAAVKMKERGKEYLADEEHAVRLVEFDNVRNGWARDLSTRFLPDLVLLNRGAKWITVQDCASSDPISILTGGRRYTYNHSGQLNLVQRCTARDARHAFVVGGSQLSGPNVFLECRSELDHATSEPHHRWSVGGLYDNVHAAINFVDRQYFGTGHGWSGANYVAWNCAGTLTIQSPPTAGNFGIGFVGTKGKPPFPGPEGWWESEGTPVAPRSLYLRQLEDRLGKEAVRNISGKNGE